MPKKKEINLGVYRVEVFPEETKEAYDRLVTEENDAAGKMFRTLLSTAAGESLSFLQSIGVDAEKLSLVRPVSEPDENGEVLFFAAARFCGSLLEGGEYFPRPSEETSGLSVIFVGDYGQFQTEDLPSDLPQVELRFVIPFTFDPTLFEKN